MIKGLVKRLKGSGFEAELPMLRVPEKVKNVGILMITANRGLCGAYNTFIIKKVQARIEDLNKQGIVPKLFIVGKKGLASLQTRLAKGVEVQLHRGVVHHARHHQGEGFRRDCGGVAELLLERRGGQD